MPSLPTPRRLGLKELKAGALPVTKFGTAAVMSPMSRISILSRSSSSSAVTEIGVIWMSVSPRRVAVTNTSSSCAWPRAGSGASGSRPKAAAPSKALLKPQAAVERFSEIMASPSVDPWVAYGFAWLLFAALNGGRRNSPCARKLTQNRAGHTPSAAGSCRDNVAQQVQR